MNTRFHQALLAGLLLLGTAATAPAQRVGPRGGTASGTIRQGGAVGANGGVVHGGRGTGTVLTPSGTTADVAGVRVAGVAPTSSGVAFGSAGGGVAIVPGTGRPVAVGHAGGGTVTNNADGSKTLHRSAGNVISSPSTGTVTTAHTGTTTGGNGVPGSYTGGTTVTAPGGTTTTDTTAANQRLTTVVTSPDGTTKTYVLGDKQVTHPPK